MQIMPEFVLFISAAAVRAYSTSDQSVWMCVVKRFPNQSSFYSFSAILAKLGT